jgi:myosin heavy subunit
VAIFSVVAAILHLGNTTFATGADGESSAPTNPKAAEHLGIAAELLGVPAAGLQVRGSHHPYTSNMFCSHLGPENWANVKF